MKYDVVVAGSGPGGYVAAIKAAQSGFKTAIVEKSELGGVCLNRGCIPTKALLKSAQVYEYAKRAQEYGIIAENVRPYLSKIVERSRVAAQTMSKGIEYLLNKNKIELIKGRAEPIGQGRLKIEKEGKIVNISAEHIILATGARPRELPSLPIDGKNIIGYRQALFPESIPESMLVVGSGAIGCELAYFYNSIGTKVTVVEYLPRIVPMEDEEISAQLSRSFRKAGIKITVNSTVDSVKLDGNRCIVNITGKKGVETIECEKVLSAVGITANIENLGLEALNIEIERGKIKVDEFYRTNVKGIYAVGDIIATPALAHVASAEASVCVEKIAGRDVRPIDYGCIPSCIYTSPEISSTGMTEKAAKEAGKNIRTGKFPFSASGKAAAAGAREGFVKLIFDVDTDKLLGAHMIGDNVTEMISDLTSAYANGITGKQIVRTIRPHPTMSEAITEAAAAAYGEVIHL